MIRVRNLKDHLTTEMGKGMPPGVYFLNNGNIICVCEDNKIIKFKVAL